MKLEAAIFDLDGTLVDTEGRNFEAWNCALAPFGIVLSEADYAGYVGKSGNIIETELQKSYGKAMPGLYKMKDKFVEGAWQEGKISCMPFAHESIGFFRSRGLKIGIATGTTRRLAKLKVERADFGSLHTLVVREDVKNVKPAPDIYLLAVERLGLPAGRCVAFEDTQFGVESAVAAGLKCYAIPNKYSRGQDFSKAGEVFIDLWQAVKHVAEAYALFNL